MKVYIRGILPDDIEPILRADHDRLVRQDPDFEVQSVPKWALDEETIFKAIRQRADPDQGTAETRTYAIEALQTLEEDGESIEVPWVCGGFSYELHDDLYGLIYTAIHPSADTERIINFIAEFLKAKAAKSKNRREIRVWLRDSSEAGLEQLMPAWRSAGFRFKLVPGWFDDADGWLGICKVAQTNKKTLEEG